MFLVLIMLANAPPVAAAAPFVSKEPLVCKRESVTGSLARFRKICKTGAQWNSAADQASADGQRMQDRGLINSCRTPTC